MCVCVLTVIMFTGDLSMLLYINPLWFKMKSTAFLKELRDTGSGGEGRGGREEEARKER